ncbi:DUF5825 family protein [Nonomuraea sp. B19D2]|uniref:DUF5825 family protein n=1 Tax=Nonomuraea sp. B19D2 TaxID=3159561 RepID=UPI0032DA3B43
MSYPSRADLTALSTRDVVDIPGTIRLDPGSPQEYLEAIRFLRDCAACGVTVHWTGECPTPAVADALTHLPPPQAPLAAGLHEQLRHWRAAYRRGAFYLRRGPGFRIVHDRRPLHAKPLRMIVGDDRLIDAMEAGDEVIRIEDHPVPPAIRHLVKAGLMLAAGDYALTLPYRLTAWPIPAYSV